MINTGSLVIFPGLLLETLVPFGSSSSVVVSVSSLEVVELSTMIGVGTLSIMTGEHSATVFPMVSNESAADLENDVFHPSTGRSYVSSFSLKVTGSLVSRVRKELFRASSKSRSYA